MNHSRLPSVKCQLVNAAQWCLVTAFLGSLTAGCSIKKMAVNAAGNALAGGGTTFSSDDDPELIKAAVPFSLKLMESLLAQSPQHKGLLFATSSGFAQYAYAFVQQEADESEDGSLTTAAEMRTRARKLYLRARNYGLRGLEVNHHGFEQALLAKPEETVNAAKVAAAQKRAKELRAEIEAEP